jgi:hydrogenase maturation factor
MIKLFVTGYIGNLGTKVLIEEKQDELVKQFNQEFIAHIKNQIEKSLLEDGFNPSLIMSDCRDETNIRRGEHCEPVSCEVVDWEAIGKGGILTSLWKLCDRNKWGLRYSLKAIPILQGTIEISNHFDINPYRLLTSNSYLVACESVGADTIRPQFLTCIGEITNEKKRVRIDGEAEAFLTKDYKDEIDKVIPNYTKR